MKGSFILALISAVLFLMPFARADLIMPSVINSLFGVMGTILFIPIILIEAMVAYFMFKKSFRFKASFLKILLIFIAANLVSAVIGFAITLPLPYYSLDTLTLIISLIIPYFLTSVIEFPVIYLFIRNKDKKALKISAKISFIVNISSYVIIFSILALSTLFPILY